MSRENIVELPEGSRDERTCFFAVPVPVGNSRGQITGIRLECRRCDANCALYDREGDRPCLTALREGIVAAILGARVPGR